MIMVNIIRVEASKCRAIKWVRQHPFLALHILYFLVLSSLGALALWAAPKAEPLTFPDALYNAVSALTETGLASVPMHRFSLPDQITLLLLMVVGGQVFTSAIPLFLRRLSFLRRSGDKFPLSPSQEQWVALPHTTNHQKKELEYEALVIMSWLTACYYVFCILTGFMVCQICVVRSSHASVVLKQSHVNSGLFSIFAVVSAYGNCGYILLDENMVPLQRSWVMLLCLGTLMLMGNTLYAPTLRFWIWLLHKRAKEERKQVYACILQSKNRRFTHIFPRNETFWLVGTVVFWNACQVMCMLGIDWRCEALKGLGVGYKLVVALFQSIAARTGGMNVVDLYELSAPTLFLALVAMYVASYPIRIINEPDQKPRGNVFVAELWKLRRKESFLFVATFLACCFERESLRDDPLNFSFFNILYEIISAYGNVGLTIGYNCSLKEAVATHSLKCKDIPCAFSGRWSLGGKAVLILVMLFGRHRNLLEDIDWDIAPHHDLLVQQAKTDEPNYIEFFSKPNGTTNSC